MHNEEWYVAMILYLSRKDLFNNKKSSVKVCLLDIKEDTAADIS